MENVLVLLYPEHDGRLGRHALEVLAAGCAVAAGLPGAALHVGLVGGRPQAAAEAVAGCAAARFLAVDGDAFSESRYATDAAAAEALARASGAAVILAPATPRCNRALPGAAQRLGGRADTHVTGISTDGGRLSISRWYYRQRIEAALLREHRPWIILLEPGCREAWSGRSGPAAVEPVAVALPALRTRVTGILSPPADEQTIRPDAKLLFVAGAGWTKKQADGAVHVEEAEKLILDFLRRSKASLGGTKSLVEQGGEGQAVLRFMSHLHQVGQTGSTPRHPKGLATCCHGEEPHTVGWRFVNERRAVNLNAGCGWAQGKADVLYVADAFEVMRRVNELLAAQEARNA